MCKDSLEIQVLVFVCVSKSNFIERFGLVRCKDTKLTNVFSLIPPLPTHTHTHTHTCTDAHTHQHREYRNMPFTISISI